MPAVIQKGKGATNTEAVRTRTEAPDLPAFVRKGISDNNAERREAGRVHMSATMIHWLARNDWSHPTFVALANWAMNEDAVMHTSQASHIRNGKTRMIGLKSLDAFGTINLAVWAYHNNKKLLKKAAPPHQGH